MKLKIATLLEARVLTSPAKIVLRFAAGTRDVVDERLITFDRRTAAQAAAESNPFIAAAREAGWPVDLVAEGGRFDRGALRQLRALLAEHTPDIVQTHAVKSHFLVSLLRERPFAWIAFHHGYTSEDLKMRLYNQLDRFSLRGCDRIVTVCQAFADDLVHKGARRERIEVVPNSIDPDFGWPSTETMRQSLRRELGIRENQAVVVAVGRLSSEKGHSYLIEAAAQLTKVAPELNFVVLVAGSGVLENSLAAAIASRQLTPRVRLIGQYADVRQLYGIADLFVLPSLSEGSPMVLLESMTAQVPILATRAGGIPEMLEDGKTARLVPIADSRALACGMQELLSEPGRAREFAAEAFRVVRERYAPARYNERILEICRSTLRDRSSEKHAA